MPGPTQRTCETVPAWRLGRWSRHPWGVIVSLGTLGHEDRGHTDLRAATVLLHTGRPQCPDAARWPSPIWTPKTKVLKHHASECHPCRGGRGTPGLRHVLGKALGHWGAVCVDMAPWHCCPRALPMPTAGLRGRPGWTGWLWWNPLSPSAPGPAVSLLVSRGCRATSSAGLRVSMELSPRWPGGPLLPAGRSGAGIAPCAGLSGGHRVQSERWRRWRRWPWLSWVNHYPVDTSRGPQQTLRLGHPQPHP